MSNAGSIRDRKHVTSKTLYNLSCCHFSRMRHTAPRAVTLAPLRFSFPQPFGSHSHYSHVNTHIFLIKKLEDIDPPPNQPRMYSSLAHVTLAFNFWPPYRSPSPTAASASVETLTSPVSQIILGGPRLFTESRLLLLLGV